MKKNIFIVSKIKKIKIKGEESPKYLVKWYKSLDETWEPIYNFSNKIETYPGYQKSLNNLFRVRNKLEKDAVKIMINMFSFSSA
tara:strand:- start:224 stop:475 length:252 start_codon:yes stop_codon:yes gene_type:complete